MRSDRRTTIGADGAVIIVLLLILLLGLIEATEGLKRLQEEIDTEAMLEANPDVQCGRAGSIEESRHAIQQRVNELEDADGKR